MFTLTSFIVFFAIFNWKMALGTCNIHNKNNLFKEMFKSLIADKLNVVK